MHFLTGIECMSWSASLG